MGSILAVAGNIGDTDRCSLNSRISRSILRISARREQAVSPTGRDAVSPSGYTEPGGSSCPRAKFPPGPRKAVRPDRAGSSRDGPTHGRRARGSPARTATTSSEKPRPQCASPPHERPGRTGQVPRLTAAFPATRQQVPRMRQIARGWLERWALPAVVVGDAELVVSELGTNAVEHGRGPVGLTLAHLPGVLRIEVTDRSSTPARPRTVAADAESGRGLLLVDALAGAWGVSPDGTVTWAELPVADDGGRQRAEPAGGWSPGVTSTFQ
ncbi:hypothetical protein DEH18_05400 [Streptomyces sp. NHF165]|uniref:ATP-binding protein n=1 Tax=Streptomyces sp. NHF165 TaxID=2175864 RepID=UPI00132F4405|nr:ATP-binding protein [Streptomyces sp. NHF165]QHF98273.1 hypothetical protein DEH18_05400 [Streptomyces sp. NHF165]